MRFVKKTELDDVPSWSLWLVAVVCFGPLTPILLLGVLALPFWFSMLEMLFAGAEPFAQNPQVTVWQIAVPIAYVISGFIGLVGLVRVSTLPRRERPRSHRIFTIGMVAVGLAALMMLNMPLLTVDDFSEGMPPGLLVYLVLPFTGAVWLLSKTWRRLIAPRA